MNVGGGFVYILASKRNGTLYVGITANLEQRMWQHVSGEGSSQFVREYEIYMLVYYEYFPNITDAIKCEKYLKGKSRKYKLNLIESTNPQWKNLYESGQILDPSVLRTSE